MGAKVRYFPHREIVNIRQQRLSGSAGVSGSVSISASSAEKWVTGEIAKVDADMDGLRIKAAAGLDAIP